MGGLFAGSAAVREAAARTAAKLGIKEVGPALLNLVFDPGSPATARTAALQALASPKDSRLTQTVEAALEGGW